MDRKGPVRWAGCDHAGPSRRSGPWRFMPAGSGGDPSRRRWDGGPADRPGRADREAGAGNLAGPDGMTCRRGGRRGMRAGRRGPESGYAGPATPWRSPRRGRWSATVTGCRRRRLAPGVSRLQGRMRERCRAPRARPDRQATRWGTFQAEGAVARPRRPGSGECRMRAAGKRLADASRRSRRTVSTSARWPCVRPPARASRRGGGGHRTAVGRPRSQSAGRGLARAGQRDVGASGVPAGRSGRGQTAVRPRSSVRRRCGPRRRTRSPPRCRREGRSGSGSRPPGTAGRGDPGSR